VTGDPLVAIIGRPNVGKSTLFNRFIGGRVAIVDDTPGVTRDRLIRKVMIRGRAVRISDTGGLVPDEASPGIIERKVREQTVEAVRDASALILVVDGRVGITSGDLAAVEVARRSGKPVVLAVNKVDTVRHEVLADDFYSLGLGEPVPVSAEHDLGLDELRDALLTLLPEPGEAQAIPPGIPAIAVVGRPNVGKSTLVNTILEEERLVTSEIPGTTRDAVDVLVKRSDGDYLFIDTAGIRRKARVSEPLEFYSVRRAMDSIDRSTVTIVVVDGVEGLTVQDRKLAELASERGKGIVLAVNKWDVAGEGKDRQKVLAQMTEDLADLRWIPIVFMSGLKGTGIDGLFSMVATVQENLTRRIPPREVAAVLAEASAKHPLDGGHRINFGTQKSGLPPAFLVFVPQPKEVPEHYKHYLETAFRRRFSLEGCPVKLFFRGKGRGQKEG
jgi:GTP-binding protein